MSQSYQFTRGLRLHGWQRACMSSWLQEKRGTVKVVTGAGKTVLGLAIVERLWEGDSELRVAIVVPTIVLMDQWYREIAEHSNIPRELVGRAGGGHSGSFTDGCRIVIWVLNTASKGLPTDVVSAHAAAHLVLIVDECHRAGAATMSRIFATPRCCSLGLSATPERSDDLDAGSAEDWPDTGGVSGADAYGSSLLGRELGPVVYTLTLAQAIDFGVLPPFEVRHYGLKLSPKEEVEYNALSRSITEARRELDAMRDGRRVVAGGLIPFARRLARSGGRWAPVASRFVNDAQRRKLLLYRAAARPEAVTHLLRREFSENPSARAILFHESVVEVERLARQLRSELPLAVGVEHSRVPEQQRTTNINAFREGELKILVSVKSLIEGFNVPAADVGIVVASSSSVRQRVQTLGRLLRHHRSSAGLEKHAVMHVLYMRDTVDETIYEREDWESSTGRERNHFFHFLPPTEPEQQPSPPRSPLLHDTQIPTASLTPGGIYPGRYDGQEYTIDTQHNVKTLDEVLIDAPAWLWQTIFDAKGQAGRFKVTDRCHYVLARAFVSGQRETTYLGRLDGPLLECMPEAPALMQGSSPALGAPYSGPVDDGGGRYLFKQVRGSRRIARKSALGLDYAVDTDGSDAAESAKLIVAAAEQLRLRGVDVSHFRINQHGVAIAQYGGQWLFLAGPTAPLAFPMNASTRQGKASERR